MCELAQLYEEKFVRIRKAHKCCETGRVLAAGAMMWKISMLHDGHWTHFYQSEPAFHFARSINRVGTLGLLREPLASWMPKGIDIEIPGNMRDYDPEYCVGFGEVRDAWCIEDEHAEEWAAVKSGVLTRWTLPTMPPDHYRHDFVALSNRKQRWVQAMKGLVA